MLHRRYQLIEDLFHEAIERGPRYLDKACAGDDSLRLEVEGLLSSYRAWSATLPPPVEPALPRFGPYQCAAILGSGGMGTVFRANREDGQFQQQVAIKVLRGSLRSEWYRQRFLSERQILARLNHPNIARLLDGGMTVEGEPYLVMELVEGKPIDVHCDQQRLGLAERLALFEQVLDAVDYAHRNMVVHRDLKPSNILVTSEGKAKLLDFGTSKLTEDDATTSSLRALTPRYASPEQLRGEPAGLPGDVFSAGVILYELLTGAHPFGEGESIVKSLERARGNAVPASPASLIDEARAEARALRVSALRQQLSGDLASILTKSLAGAAAERYATAAAMREDLARYQSGRPVEAKPATLVYRVTRFVNRHRWGVAAAAAVFALLAAAGFFSWRQAVAARLEARRANEELVINRQLFDYTTGVFRQAAPVQFDFNNRANFKSITVAEALQRASDSLPTGTLSPEVEIPLRYWFQTIQSLMLSKDAAQKSAVTIRGLARTPYHKALADDIACRDTYQRNDYEAAAPFCQAALQYLDAHPEAELPWRSGVLICLSGLAMSRTEMQRAEAYVREAHQWSERRFPPTHYATTTSMQALAIILRNNRKPDEAEAVLKKLLSIQQSLPVPPFEMAATLNTLAGLYGGKPDRAGETEAYEEAERVLTRYTPDAVLCNSNHRYMLAARARNRGDRTAAAAMAKVLAGCPTTNEMDRYTTLVTYGETLTVAGRLADAEREMGRALQAVRKATRRGTGHICFVEHQLAHVLFLRQKNMEEARKLLLASRAEYLQVFGPNNNLSVQRIDKAIADLDQLRLQ